MMPIDAPIAMGMVKVVSNTSSKLIPSSPIRKPASREAIHGVATTSWKSLRVGSTSQNSGSERRNVATAITSDVQR
ncbi:hypothetical protein HRbin20_01510 [bacterium HR20]|nr:hypothetical protein HRbin20_01510 [bacterium HR20]